MPFFALSQAQTNNHIIAAREYLNTGDQLRAKLELDSALRLAPESSLANELMGDLNKAKKRYSRAITSYDKAIMASTSQPELYMKRAEMHRKLKNHRIYILNDYNDAIKLDPANIDYYKIKADYFATNINPDTHKYDFEGASSTITDAIAINKNDTHLHFLKARYLMGSEQFLSALAEINTAIMMDNLNDAYYAERGAINFKISRYEDSKKDFTRAIRMNEAKFDYYESRGHTNYNLGNYVEAYDDYSTAIDMIIIDVAKEQGSLNSSNPLNKSLRLNLLYRGMTLVQENRPYDGCDDFKRAYQMGESKARNYMRKYCY